MAVDASHVYWADTAGSVFPPVIGIARANLDGSSIDQDFISSSSSHAGYPTLDVAVDANHIYWTQHSIPTGAVARANLDGTSVDRGSSQAKARLASR